MNRALNTSTPPFPPSFGSTSAGNGSESGGSGSGGGGGGDDKSESLFVRYFKDVLASLLGAVCMSVRIRFRRHLILIMCDDVIRVLVVTGICDISVS